jgi:hypothetical protein
VNAGIPILNIEQGILNIEWNAGMQSKCRNANTKAQVFEVY